MIKRSDRCYFNRQTTFLIKGILLILMFILHFFCFPSWYISGIGYPNLLWMQKLQGHFQICIAGFTFLTGYLYYYANKQQFKYVLKKWMDILIPYWFIFITFFLIAYFTNTYLGNFKMFILELFALKYSVMFFCWYVPYYIMMILALWIIVRIINNDMIRWLISLVGSYVLYWFILHYFKVDFIINIVEKFSVYFPITITGYLCSKRMLFEKIKKHIGKIDIPFSILVLFVVFLEPSWLYGLEINNVMLEMMRKVLRILSIPLFVYGLVEVCHKINNNILIRLLSAIGESSMLMWFIHGIFLIAVNKFFNRYYIYQNFPS